MGVVINSLFKELVPRGKGRGSAFLASGAMQPCCIDYWLLFPVVCIDPSYLKSPGAADGKADLSAEFYTTMKGAKSIRYYCPLQDS
jgi:hypothetical protein